MTELRQFQKEGVRMIYDFKGRALLADEQGLGKTLEALEWIRRTPRHRPVVIVTPSSLKYTWQKEASMHFGMRSEVLEGRPRKSLGLSSKIIILNYDILQHWLKVLLKNQPTTVIFDECHYIKNPEAARTKAAQRLSANASSVVGLSGTPMTNQAIDLWSILSCIRPELFPSRLKFAWRYCKPKATPWGWQFNGAVKKKELNRILRERVLIRRLKKDVAKELPDKIHKVISFKLDSYQEYNKARTDFLGWLKKISPAKAKRAKRSQALVKIGYLLRLVAEIKLKWTIKWLEEFKETHPGKKLVGLTMHTSVIDALKKKFPNSIVIDGRVKGKLRTESVRRFQTDKKIPFFFGNWKAAGVGITLTAAHHFASFDFPWTPGDLSQGLDRIHRIGQEKTVFIYFLMAMNTLEESQLTGLKKKGKVLSSILDGGRTAKDFDMLDTLLQEVMNEP